MGGKTAHFLLRFLNFLLLFPGVLFEFFQCLFYYKVKLMDQKEPKPLDLMDTRTHSLRYYLVDLNNPYMDL